MKQPGVVIDFAAERAMRRPDELAFDIQQTLNLCSDGVDTSSFGEVKRFKGENYAAFYLRDLGKRMLASFMELGRVAKPIRDQYDQLDPNQQIEVEDSIKNFKDTGRS